MADKSRVQPFRLAKSIPKTLTIKTTAKNKGKSTSLPTTPAEAVTMSKGKRKRTGNQSRVPTDSEEGSNNDEIGLAVSRRRSATTQSMGEPRSDHSTIVVKPLPDHNNSDISSSEVTPPPNKRKKRSKRSRTESEVKGPESRPSKSKQPGGKQFALRPDQLEEVIASEDSRPDVPAVFDEALTFLSQPTDFRWVDDDENPPPSEQRSIGTSPIHEWTLENTALYRRTWPESPPKRFQNQRGNISHAEDLYDTETSPEAPRGSTGSQDLPDIPGRTSDMPITIIDNGTPSPATSDEIIEEEEQPTNYRESSLELPIGRVDRRIIPRTPPEGDADADSSSSPIPRLRSSVLPARTYETRDPVKRAQKSRVPSHSRDRQET